jgi:hypothetical protein
MVTNWADYIDAMSAMATRALAGLDDDSLSLDLIETSESLGPCPSSLQPAAMAAAQRLHDVLSAYERRQEMVVAELSRMPQVGRAPQRCGDHLDLSA